EDVRILRTVSARLAQHRGHHAIGRPLEQLEDEGTPDAVAQHEKLADTEVVHEAELIVRICVPGLLDLERPSGLPGVRIAEVHADAAEVVLELLHGVEGRPRRPPRDGGIEPAPWDQEQWEPGADLFIVDAHVATLVEWHWIPLLGV